MSGLLREWPVPLLCCHYEGSPLCSSECFGSNRRCVCSNGTADRHEEAAHAKSFVSRAIPHGWLYHSHLHSPECRSRPGHILAQGPHNAVWSGTVSEDIHSPWQPWVSRNISTTLSTHRERPTKYKPDYYADSCSWISKVSG